MRKSQGRRGPKCKAPREGPRTPPEPPSPRPWLPGLVHDALSTGDLLGACARAAVSLYDLQRLRAESPEADALLAEVDQLVTLRAVEAVRAAAAAGDLRAVRAIADGTLARLLPGVDRARGQAVYGWTKCPGCHQPVYALASTDGRGNLTVRLYPPEHRYGREALHTARPHVRDWIDALDRGEPWAVEIVTRRESRYPPEVLEQLRQMAKQTTR